MIRRLRNGTIEADTPRELADYMVAVGNAAAIVDAERQLSTIIDTVTPWRSWSTPSSMDVRIPVKETITEERELVIAPPDSGAMFYGCGAVVRSPGPNKLMLRSICSGFSDVNLIADHQELDITFFQDPDLSVIPFDFGCFSGIAQLRIVVRTCDGPVELDMEIIGAMAPLPAHTLSISRLWKPSDAA